MHLAECYKRAHTLICYDKNLSRWICIGERNKVFFLLSPKNYFARSSFLEGKNKSQKIKEVKTMSTCAVSTECEEPKFSLPLTRKGGKWVVTPVCAKCKSALMSEAYAQGKTIRFFSLAGSLVEAEKRNANTPKLTPFLDAFARAERRPVSHNGNGDKRKLEVKA
jgi:hypothetical protein